MAVDKERDYKFYVINMPIKGNMNENSKLYTEFFKFLFNHKKPEKIRADKGAIIRKCTPTENGKVLYGFISTFTMLDGKEWIDVVSLEKDEVSIPKNKFPNLKEVLYFFFPKHHKLLLLKTSYSASMSSVMLYLNVLKQKLRKYDFDVIQETSSDLMESIMKAESVTSLDFTITYTNAGVGGDAYDFVDGEMKRSGMKQLSLHARSEKGGSIEINESMILSGVAELVPEYGSGTARITENGKQRTVDTKAYPLVLKIKANIKEFGTFISKLVSLVDRNTGSNERAGQ